MPNEDKAGSSSSANDFQWELNMENVKPVRRGRRADALSEALSKAPPSAEKTVSEKFETMMKECETVDDPLALCIGFCRWFDDTFPIGRQRLFYKYLWIIAKKYSIDGRYTDDERMLIIWDKLAENSLGHGYEVYQHAYSVGSLLRCTALYIRWADDLELRGSINEVRTVFNKAQRKGALPAESLHSAIDAFELREMRRQVEETNNVENYTFDDDDDDLVDENEERAAFQRIKTFGESVAPVVRLPSIVGEQGSSKLPTTLKTPQQPPSSGFDVFTDNDPSAEENYLESIYDMHMDNHIERLSLKEANGERLEKNTNSLKKPTFQQPRFAVYSDDKENIDPNNGEQKKPKLAFMKCLLHESIEEYRARKWEEEDEVKKTKKVSRRINFDEE